MRLRVLGCSGGSAPGRNPSCFLLDDGVAVDAGALAATLTLDEQQAVSHVFLTHAHWDHVRDLPLTVINRRADTPPLVVHGLPETIDVVRRHLMNGETWFEAFDLPSAETPYVAAAPIRPGETHECGRYRITAVAVPHTVPAVSYLVDDGKVSILLNADTGGGGIFRGLRGGQGSPEHFRDADPDPAVHGDDAAGGGGGDEDDDGDEDTADIPMLVTREMLARVLAAASPLRAVFLEASFPNRSREFACLTGHLTPDLLRDEIADLPADVEVIVTHLKPGYETELAAEIADLGRHGARCCRDGDVFSW